MCAAVPSVDALSTIDDLAIDVDPVSQRSRHASISARELKVTMMIDSRGIQDCARRALRQQHLQRPLRAFAPRIACQLRRRRPQAARSPFFLIEQRPLEAVGNEQRVRPLDVDGRRAVDLAGDIGIQQHDRDAGAKRLQRRHGKPFVLRQEHERPGPLIERCQFVVAHVRPRADASRGRGCCAISWSTSMYGRVRLSPTRTRRTDGCVAATRSNPARSSGMWRLLKSEPTNRTVGSPSAVGRLRRSHRVRPR